MDDRLKRVRAVAVRMRNAEAELHRLMREAKGAGMTYQEIADAAGLTRSGAWKILNREHEDAA